MIVDESTVIKTHNAKRTKNLLKLSKDIATKNSYRHTCHEITFGYLHTVCFS